MFHFSVKGLTEMRSNTMVKITTDVDRFCGLTCLPSVSYANGDRNIRENGIGFDSQQITVPHLKVHKALCDVSRGMKCFQADFMAFL